MGVDTSEGGDLSALVIKSKASCDSFLVFSGHYNSAELPPMIKRAYLFLHATTGLLPWIGVERNFGMATINKLVEWEYPKLYKQRTFDSTIQKHTYKIGWWNSRTNRQKLLDELALAVRQGETLIYDLLTVKQLLTFVRNRRSGKPEAESGCFDDLVIAEGIALQLFYTTTIDDEAVGRVKAVRPGIEKQFKTVKEEDRIKKYDLDELKKYKKPRHWKAV